MMTIEEGARILTPLPESQARRHLDLVFENKDPVKEGCTCIICEDDRKKAIDLCECTGPIEKWPDSHGVAFDNLDMANGTKVTFVMIKCSRCGKPGVMEGTGSGGVLLGALTAGTEETKQMIRESYKDMDP
jgi:hypothetical protein